MSQIITKGLLSSKLIIQGYYGQIIVVLFNKMFISLSTKRPGITATHKQPELTFTTKRPSITATHKQPELTFATKRPGITGEGE